MEVTGKELHITMQEDSKQLDEVVVVGYGSQKKVNVTGSVSMVNADVLESRPVQNVSQALQGVIPGLNMSVGSSGGTLDGKLNVNIRGAGTISDGSSSSPLVLIDGIEGDMNTVNPNDIESVSVLKDAASSSIYGARAANGVIVVTTKRGKTGKPVINFNTKLTYTPNLNTSRLNLLNSEEKVDLELQLLKEARFDILWGLTDPIPVFPEK